MRRIRVLFCLRWALLIMISSCGGATIRAYMEVYEEREFFAYFTGACFLVWFIIRLLFHRYERRTEIMMEEIDYSTRPPPKRF